MNKYEAIEEKALNHEGSTLRVSDEEAETILHNLPPLNHPLEYWRYQLYLKTKRRAALSRALSELHYCGVNIVLDNPVYKKHTGKYY